MKQMSPDMKLIILANMNVKLFMWTFTFRNVVRQQIGGEVLLLLLLLLPMYWFKWHCHANDAGALYRVIMEK